MGRRKVPVDSDFESDTDHTHDPNFDEEADSSDEESDDESEPQAIDPKVLLDGLKAMLSSSSMNKRKSRECNRKRKTKDIKPKEHHKKRKFDKDESKARSRFNVTYFSNVLDALSVSQREIIENSPLSPLLHFSRCAIPMSFVQWIASKVDVRCSDIVINGKLIPLSPESVHMVFGLPIGGSEIKLDDESGKTFFTDHYDEPSIPPISFFGNMLFQDQKKAKLSKDEVIRCFMVVALSTFLCPNSNTYPSPKYLSPLLNVESIGSWDWCTLIYDWLIRAITNFQKDTRKSHQSSKTLGGSGFYLAVKYLDFIDFGPHSIPQSIPRISIWKDDMIRKYSKLDTIEDHVFGRRPVKDFFQTCYAIAGNIFQGGQSCNNSYLSICRGSLERFSTVLEPKLLDEVSILYDQFAHSGLSFAENSKVQQLLVSVIDCIAQHKQAPIEDHPGLRDSLRPLGSQHHHPSHKSINSDSDPSKVQLNVDGSNDNPFDPTHSDPTVNVNSDSEPVKRNLKKKTSKSIHNADSS